MAVSFDGVLAPMHWFVVGIVALLVLGPERLPEAAQHASRVMRMVRDARASLAAELHQLSEPASNQSSIPPD